MGPVERNLDATALELQSHLSLKKKKNHKTVFMAKAHIEHDAVKTHHVVCVPGTTIETNIWAFVCYFEGDVLYLFTS